MTRINIDFETRSTVDLRKTGVYPYAAHPDTDIWCMAYAIDDGPVQVWTPGMEPLFDFFPVHAPGTELRAWNAGFEHIIYRDIMVPRYGFPPVRTEQWVDTAAEAAALALPRSLGKAAKVLGLDVEKDDEGWRLMMKMARPRAIGAWWALERVLKTGITPDYHEEYKRHGPFPTKAAAIKFKKEHGLTQECIKDDHTIIWWDDDEFMLRRLIDYCKQDVEVERAAMHALRPLRVPERHVYLMNQRMNDRGIQVDTELVEAARDIMEIAVAEGNAQLKKITGGKVKKVSQVANMRAWINENSDLTLDNLRKDTLRDLLEADLPDDVRAVLQIRQDLGKTSTAKLDAFERVVAGDGRAHGLLLYHGASTGRWAGALVQPQNFPRPVLDGVEDLIPLVLARDYEALQEHAPPAVIIASMLRSMLVAAPGHVLLAADYSQIEARVLAWIAGQQDLVDLFAEGGKIYETMAAYIFNLPVEDVAKDSFERQIGKNSVLGAGFQMGADRFAEQVREQTGILLERGRRWWCKTCKRWGTWLPDHEREVPCPICGKLLQRQQVGDDVADMAIKGYRELYSEIPKFWRNIEAAAIQAVKDPNEVYTVGADEQIKFTYRADFLWCQLPSKRFLAYASPQIKVRPLPEPYQDVMKESLSYLGVDSLTKQWRRHYTYGGHLTENVVQAMARDLMAGAMLRVEQAGYRPVLTVHDEVVVEAHTEEADFSQFMDLMQVLPRWAEGLPVAAEGWQGQRYRK